MATESFADFLNKLKEIHEKEVLGKKKLGIIAVERQKSIYFLKLRVKTLLFSSN